MESMLRLLLVLGIFLFVVWVLGFVTSYYLGGYIHIVLVIAIICFVAWLVMYLKGPRK